MRVRELGTTGILVSPLGLGTVKFGRAEGVKYPTPVRIPDDAEARSLIELAQRRGINLIDTAPAYGASEERLGGLLAGQRERWVIVTKVGEEFEGGRSRFDFSPASVRASVERSLRRLRTDRVDVVLIHSDGVMEVGASRDETLDALVRLRDEGKARAVGVSSKTPEGARWAIERGDVVMVTLNPAERRDEPVVELAASRGVGVLVKKALASGHVTAAVGDPAMVAGGTPRSTSESALTFVLSHAGVSCVVVGTTNPMNLASNCDAADRATLNRGT